MLRVGHQYKDLLDNPNCFFCFPPVPDDFISQFGSFVLTPSQSRACINVPIEDDNVLEADESFSGTLVGDLPPTASFNFDFTTVVIRDNESELKLPNIFPWI